MINIENINIYINNSKDDLIVDKLKQFNLVNRTPIECMMFIEELIEKYEK
jgi:hypothetical protein